MSLKALALWIAFCPGCVVGAERPVIGPASDPPPGREEPRPSRPPHCDECRWSPGYWHWDGANYEWVTGHWERPALVPQ